MEAEGCEGPGDMSSRRQVCLSVPEARPEPTARGDQAGLRLAPVSLRFLYTPQPGEGLRSRASQRVLTRLGSKEELFWSPVPQEPELGRSSRPAGRQERVRGTLTTAPLRSQRRLPPVQGEALLGLSRSSRPFVTQPGPGACLAWCSPCSAGGVRPAQGVERVTLHLRTVSSSPTPGAHVT